MTADDDSDADASNANPSNGDDSDERTDARRLVRAYYDALDDGAIGRLDDVLAADFVQRRPDRTFEGRDAFCTFMREERPRMDTTHAIDAVYVASRDDPENSLSGGTAALSETEPPATELPDTEPADSSEIAVRGRVLDDGEAFVRFVDVHRVVDGRIAAVLTYTR